MGCSVEQSLCLFILSYAVRATSIFRIEHSLFFFAFCETLYHSLTVVNMCSTKLKFGLVLGHHLQNSVLITYSKPDRNWQELTMWQSSCAGWVQVWEETFTGSTRLDLIFLFCHGKPSSNRFSCLRRFRFLSLLAILVTCLKCLHDNLPACNKFQPCGVPLFSHF